MDSAIGSSCLGWKQACSTLNLTLAPVYPCLRDAKLPLHSTGVQSKGAPHLLGGDPFSPDKRGWQRQPHSRLFLAQTLQGSPCRAASTGCQAQDRGLCAGCHCSTGERHECSRRRSPQWAPGICLVEKVTGLSFP
ncbi:unnamed protein product [Natator depressus]